MAPTRGFQSVINGNLNGAGVVLPDSQAENFAIQDILRNGLLRQQAAASSGASTTQLNKDFATNPLKVAPTIQYRSEVSGLAQKWYDKGVEYRRQGFNPFTPDYNKPDQVAASQEYLAEKKHIEDLADLGKEVDNHYNANLKASQEGKLDGFDEYQAKLQNTTLRDLYDKGGINALPQLYKPFDTGNVDKEVVLKPQTRQVDQEIAPGVVNKVTEHYVDLPQAARSVETAILNQPGAKQYFKKKKGIDNVDNLYTKGGHNIILDPNNPEDLGHIDEPGIYHQMATDYLTKPNLIKQLPDEVKQKIINNGKAMKLFNGDVMDLTKAGKELTSKPYQPSQDPDFKKFIDQKFEDQVKQERAYQSEIADGVARKLPTLDLGSTSKMDATLANLKLRQESNNQGWERLGIAKDNHGIARAKWQEHLADKGTRLNWINSLESVHPDAVRSLKAALSEVHGTLKPIKGGFVVNVPEKVPNYIIDRTTGKPTTTVNTVNPTKIQDHVYKIEKYRKSRGQRIILEQIINKLPTFGKEKALKTEPYNATYNNLSSTDSADDL